MKVYIKDYRLIIDTLGVPFANYVIQWNVPESDIPTSFRFMNMNTERFLLSNNYINITDCETETGVPYSGYDDFITAVGSFFVRALTAAEGAIDTRLTNLESNESIYQIFEFTGTTQIGTITIPQEATVYDLYNDGLVDQIVVKASPEGMPMDELVKTASGQTITVVSLDQDGNYALSGIPADNACLVYFITIQDKYKENIPLSIIVDHVDIDFISEIDKINSDISTLEGNGVVSGMTISINTTNTKYNISSGIYHTYGGGNKFFLQVFGKTPLGRLTANATYVGVQISNGVVIEQLTKFTRKQRRTIIPLGTVVHSNRNTINAINNTPDVAVSMAAQFNDLMGVFNIINVEGGNIFSANGSNLSINKSDGEILRGGVNFSTDIEDPLVKSLPALVAPTTIRHRLSNGTEYADTSTVQLFYESAPGVRTALSNNDFVIHRIYIFPSNLVRIQLGATIYNSMASAKQALYSDKITVEANLKENGLLRALLIVRGNATALNDPTQAEFFSTNMFGDIAFGAAGGTTTLQQAYLNSLIPQISVTDTQGALTVKSTRALATSKILELLNSTDQSIFNITAEGRLQIGDIVGGNYLEIEPDGTIKNNGTGSTFRDEYPSILLPAGGAQAPDLVNHTVGGVLRQFYGFDGGGTEERISGSFEIPHDWKYGSPIEVHVHWRPATTGTGNVEWFLDWEYSPPQSASIPKTTLSTVVTIPANEQYVHKLDSLGLITDTAAFTIGGKIGFNLRRTSNGTNDTYTGDALLEQISLHVETDTSGSRQRYIK